MKEEAKFASHSAAVWTNSGKLKPFGKILRAPDSDAYECIFPRAQEIEPQLRATNEQLKCRVA